MVPGWPWAWAGLGDGTTGLQELPLKVSSPRGKAQSEGAAPAGEPVGEAPAAAHWEHETESDGHAPPGPGQGSVVILLVGYRKGAQQAVSSTTRAHRRSSMLEPPAPPPPWGGHAQWPTSAGLNIVLRALQGPPVAQDQGRSEPRKMAAESCLCH